MSREKQIEEMARVWCPFPERHDCKGCCERCYEISKSEMIYEAGYRKIPDNIGEFSDGYHTFNELYHHRAVLFSVICNMFPNKAWKSKLHDTGDMFDGMFIVGIETEQGQATYHYDIKPYWDMFKVKELEKAPKWDGHTPSEAIERIGNMSVKPSEWISVEERLPEESCECLVATNIGSVYQVNYSHRYKAFNALDTDGAKYAMITVTHWMPLPEPPKMKGGGE